MGLKGNIGSYILLIIIFVYIILGILFKIKGFSKLKEIIKDIVKINKDETKKRTIKKRSSNNYKKHIKKITKTKKTKN